MKRTFLKILFLLICLISIISLSTENKKNDQLTDLVFNNTEALASGESGGKTNCLGSGSVDCNRYKVSYAVSGYSINLNE